MTTADAIRLNGSETAAMKKLPKSLQREIAISDKVSAHAAERLADKMDYDARLAYLDGRLARSKTLSQQASFLRSIARKSRQG